MVLSLLQAPVGQHVIGDVMAMRVVRVPALTGASRDCLSNLAHVVRPTNVRLTFQDCGDCKTQKKSENQTIAWKTETCNVI